MNSQEKIEKLLNYLEINSKEFSERLGYDRPQIIYDIQKGKTKRISETLANKIISVFPNIRKAWLLADDGEMLTNTEEICIDSGKKERILLAYDYLRSKGFIHTQSDLAEKMQSNKVNVSRAMAGNERYLTDKFLKRLNNSFGGVFNEDWLLYGDGEMLDSNPIHTSIGNTEHSSESILLQIIEQKEAIIRDKDKQIMQLSETIGMLKQQIIALQAEMGKIASTASKEKTANAG